MLNSYACDNLAALWDLQHTFRDAGEAPEKTVKNLGAYIKHVHLKDSEIVETAQSNTASSAREACPSTR